MRFFRRWGTLLLISVPVLFFSSTSAALQADLRQIMPATTAANSLNAPTSHDSSCRQCHEDPQQSLQQRLDAYWFPEDTLVAKRSGKASGTDVFINFIGILCLLVITAAAHPVLPRGTLEQQNSKK